MLDQRRTDPVAEQIIADYRERFCDGPIGTWRSSLDHQIGFGFDGTGLFGNRIEFRPDGSGVLVSRGTGNREETRFT